MNSDENSLRTATDEPREPLQRARAGQGADLITVSEWEQPLKRMKAEWQALTDGHTALQDLARVQQAVAWDVAFEAVRDEYEGLRLDGRWVSGPADLLGVIGQSRWETYHSRLIAWLLDPRMRHGFGTLFLERFLRACYPDEVFASLADAWCQWEVPRGSARADIIVWSSDLTLIVENKIDAVECPRQCDGYVEGSARNRARVLSSSPQAADRRRQQQVKPPWLFAHSAMVL